MTMGPGDELRIPLRLDTSQIESDLREVDKYLAQLERRIVSTFNRLTSVRRGTSARAESLADVRKELSGLSDDDLRAAMLSLRGPMNAYGARAAQLGAQAAAGRATLPPTAQQSAAMRLAQVQRQTKPVEITARARFFDDMRQGLMRGLPSVATSTATGGLPAGASSAARLIMGLVGDNPIGAGALAGAGIVGGVAVAANQNITNFQRQQAALSSALVGGPAFGDSRTMLGLGIMAAGQALGMGQQQSQGIAQTLASAGMTPGAVTANVSNVGNLVQRYGLPQGTVESIVAALGTAGGMNPQQIARALQDIAKAGPAANVSILQMAQAMQAVAQTNPVAAGRAAFGLAAIQQVLGGTSGINAGQLMAPAMGATGVQALQNAALLNMTPDQYANASPTQLWNAAANVVRNLPPGATGTYLGETLLGGVLGIGNLPAAQQAHVINQLRRVPAARVLADLGRIKKAPAPKPPPIQQSWLEWLGIHLGNAFTTATNAPHPSGAAPVAPPTGGAPIPQMFPIAAPSAPTQRHEVHLNVTVKDQAGRTIGTSVDPARVVVGAPTTVRPPAVPPWAPRRQ